MARAFLDTLYRAPHEVYLPGHCAIELIERIKVAGMLINGPLQPPHFRPDEQYNDELQNARQAERNEHHLGHCSP